MGFESEQSAGSDHYARHGDQFTSPELFACALLKQIGVRACAHENHQAMFFVAELVCQQKVASDVALSMPHPIATQRVIEPFLTEWAIVGDQQKHGFFESVHVVPARS